MLIRSEANLDLFYQVFGNLDHDLSELGNEIVNETLKEFYVSDTQSALALSILEFVLERCKTPEKTQKWLNEFISFVEGSNWEDRKIYVICALKGIFKGLRKSSSETK